MSNLAAIVEHMPDNQSSSNENRYKKIAVGVIPEDWELSTVGNEFEVQLGKMLDTEKNVGIPKPYLTNRSVQWGRIDIDDLPLMRMSRSDLEQFRLRCGDLLVCEGGEVGRAAIWESQLEECYYQKALHRLRPVSGFNTELMLAFLRYWSDHSLLSDYVSQTSIAHLTREKFIEVPLPVPPPLEQQAIAAALSDADALIASLDKLIAKKRDMKAAAMQQLLIGTVRLPGFDVKKGWRQTEVGMIPVEWEVTSVRDMAQIRTGPFGTLLKAEEYSSQEGVPLISVREIGEGLLHIDEKTPRVPSFIVRRLPEYVLNSGDIVFGRKGAVDRSAMVSQNQNGWFLGSDGIRLRLSKICHPQFIAFQLQRKEVRNWLLQHATGTTMASLNQDVLGRVCIPIAPLPEQRAIATILSDMDAEIAALEARQDKMRAIKQGMMQELLTGRTRLV